MGRDEIWQLTLAEVFEEILVARERAKATSRRDLTNCWLIAAFTRMPKMPPIAEILRSGPQTPEEQAEVWRQAANAFGWRVQRHNKRRRRIVRAPRHAEQLNG